MAPERSSKDMVSRIWIHVLVVDCILYIGVWQPHMKKQGLAPWRFSSLGCELHVDLQISRHQL
jgi:hypothetical protein